MQYPSNPAIFSGVTALHASSHSLASLGDHHVVFPDLIPAGPRHVMNFALPSAVGERPVHSDGPGSDEQAFCLRWIFRQAGLNVHDYRQETVQRRIPSMLRALRAGSLPEARSLLRANPQLLPEAMDALLIGVTSFFRDSEVFDAIRETAIPELSSPGGEVHIWGAACSDGSELVSLAVMLAESGLLQRAHLLGTDCRTSAVLQARRGSFAAGDLCELDPQLRRRYFRLHGEAWCVSPVIQNRLRWRAADLLREIEPGEWDMILCRNFAIYLRSGAAIALWMRLRGAIRRGGFLVTGKAERVESMGGFRKIGPCVYRREE